jgi:DNA-binding transcriptional ArsR family regulator
MSGRARPKDALFDQLARVGKALANSKRLQIIDVLAQSERTVESLAQATALKLTTASAHLQTLRASGLVLSRRDGSRIYYRLASSDVTRLYVMLRDVASKYLAETERAAREFLGEDELEPVSRDDLLHGLRNGELVLLDVRPAVEFAAAHIEGAIGIPLEELCERLAELPAELAVRLLRAKGRAARRLSGGMLEWGLENRPTG